ncbi:hypothetical protein CHH49_16625 [Terribacillus saccharophilus]|uniref:hypothetical protein n=1 Tax=Terribacillus saccharophilus TaxID=361277 RepID=UPI000BA58E9C|nr:hypothetical protein [Terribacillus saccharophilus]PAF20401.1 hypothetical protein CHH49_16625 [Terribacillus saccharophilus]
MKKLNISLSLIILLLIFTGCTEEYDEETIMKAKQTAESYLRNNYQDVESIELEEPYQSPMGSLSIDGTVNGAGFTIDLNEDFTVAMVGKKEGFPEHKDVCEEKDCDY